MILPSVGTQLVSNTFYTGFLILSVSPELVNYRVCDFGDEKLFSAVQGKYRCMMYSDSE